MLYPVINKYRSIIDLNGIWDFKIEGVDDQIDVTRPLDTDLVMAVPGSYNDQGVTSDIRNHVGNVWYERTFTIPNVLRNERVVLRFGSATHKATVYIDGKEVTSHQGGFLPFEVDFDSEFGSGQHRLTVCVNNILDETTLPVGEYSETINNDGKIIKKNSPNFDFFNYAGLHRPVKIYTTPKVFIEDIEIVPEVLENSAKVQYKVTTNEAVPTIVVKLRDEKDNIVAETSGAEGIIEVDNPHLWQPLNAYLYHLEVTLLDNDQVIDTYAERFGIRSVEVREGQFLINGEPFYFKGFGKHEDAYYSGRGMNEVTNVLDFNLMKWIGANSFRTSHYPYSEEMMRLADEQGIVIIDETTAVGVHLNFSAILSGTTTRDTFKEIGTKEAHEAVIKDLIERDKNYACVVMWSVANEPASTEKGAKAYFEPLVNLARACDPQQRPVTIVTILTSQPDTCEVQDLVDVLCLNRYYGWYTQSGDLEAAKEALRTELDGWSEKQPGKPIMFTEYGADTIAGMHAINDELFTEEYQIRYYEANHEVIDNYPQFIGEQTWNFADFETSSGIIRVQGNKKGIFTRERRPKAVAHYFKKRWDNIPDFGYKQ
ncbi:beta-glucuronidase [Staphylococcus equorum]|uniref:beta-glucuronidase n=1 Tax=Staphylococcus TaxID=1279 RepID=UPI00039664A3|nr:MULTISPECIES: beta-glucuronidase [Staphylococcus]ANK39062.1 beta-galactosidase/beta-glucuronidase [Staphylococcus sp. AntiMn-1]ERH36455.1 beta-D-glucuronidase [Staphylococcus equorum UMC-CNS-924]MEB7672081.1 beta-glucuronidase [Staphylococcus equorum]MEB7689393.1 beta-glucuronidase [Staphylococcus equorum]MEB7717077.1 beta-glucuronidase [Staphylococcus equorum]